LSHGLRLVGLKERWVGLGYENWTHGHVWFAMRQRLTAIPQSLILHKIRGHFVDYNKHNNKLTGFITPSRAVCIGYEI